MALGAGTSITFGYIIDEHTPIGDGHYTKRDATIDGVMGGFAVGGVFKVANTARKAYKYRRAGKIARETGETSIPLRVGLQYNDDVLIAGVEIMARNETIRLGLHGGALIAGELAKIEGRQPGQPTTVEFGGREIFILDPYASLTTVTQPSSGQSSKLPRGATPKYLNRTSAKSKTKKSSRRSTMAPCRCKDGSYSINCC